MRSSVLDGGAGSAFAEGTAASLAAAIIAGSLPSTPGWDTGATDATGAGVGSIGAAAASDSASASSWADGLSAAVRTGSGLGVVAGAVATFGATILTVTVLTLTGVSGALEP